MLIIRVERRDCVHLEVFIAEQRPVVKEGHLFLDAAVWMDDYDESGMARKGCYVYAPRVWKTVEVKVFRDE